MAERLQPLLPAGESAAGGVGGGGGGPAGEPAVPAGSGAAAAPASAVRSLGAVGVCAVLFASVAGGPYGIEAAVGAAGAAPVLVGCAALAALWSAPQALVAAELSCAFPSGGGALGWVAEALGPAAGALAAANSLAAAAANLPLYPVLAAAYAGQLLGPAAATPAVLWAAKLATLAGAAAVNAAGIDAVSAAAAALSLAVQAPFAALPLAALAARRPWRWSAALAVLPGWRDNASVFVATIIWNMAGWSNIGNLAGEVADPAAAYTRGSAAAVALVALNYIYPVAVGIALSPDAAAWDAGYFADVGEAVAPWLGVWITAGAALSLLNNVIPYMASVSMGRTLGLPRILAGVLGLGTCVR